MSEPMSRDYFGTPIYIGDTIVYPASGDMLEATVIDVSVNSKSVRTVSCNGTKKWKMGKFIFAKDKTLDALREKYPEDHI